jgi:transcriptional regulator with XRE-family HTH domain
MAKPSQTKQTIRRLRLQHGLTQQGLGHRVGVSKTAVFFWESGRNEPSARQLEALADVFRVPMHGIAFHREEAVIDYQKEEG